MRYFKDYITPLLKWWWLIIAAPLIAAVSAFLFARQLPPVYQAKTTLLIGRAIQDPNPSGNEFSMSYQLATEYANMATREPVRNAAKAALGLTDLPEYQATARGIFLEIAVIHTDPRFAQAVANVLAQQLILISPVNLQQSTGNDQQFVEKQLKELQDNIEKTRQEITTKQGSLSGLDSALDIAQSQNELKALEDKMATLQEIYSNLFSSTREAAFNTLSVFDTASLPTQPIGPRKTLIVLLAAVSGLAFAVAAAYLIEYLDDTIKTTDEISRLIDIPAIAYIGEMQGFKPTFVASHPRSPTADAFRGLRTNLEFMSVDKPMKTLSVSSAEASDGKSTIAINLAIVIAQSEKKVILVDADLRSPSVHRYLGISDNPGLSDVFLDRVKVKDALVEWDGTPPFLIMPAGSVPPNSAELLGSRKMDQILSELAGMADIVILDGPPGFVVDAIVLSAKVDAVLLVVNIGETRRGSMKAVVEQFKRIEANLVGTVLNRVTKGSGYYGSYYYSGYYSKEPVTRPVQSGSRNKPKWNITAGFKKFISRLIPARAMPKEEEVIRALKKAPAADQPLQGEPKFQEVEFLENDPTPGAVASIENVANNETVDLITDDNHVIEESVIVVEAQTEEKSKIKAEKTRVKGKPKGKAVEIQPPLESNTNGKEPQTVVAADVVAETTLLQAEPAVKTEEMQAVPEENFEEVSQQEAVVDRKGKSTKGNGRAKEKTADNQAQTGTTTKPKMTQPKMKSKENEVELLALPEVDMIAEEPKPEVETTIMEKEVASDSHKPDPKTGRTRKSRANQGNVSETTR